MDAGMDRIRGEGGRGREDREGEGRGGRRIRMRTEHYFRGPAPLKLVHGREHEGMNLPEK